MMHTTPLSTIRRRQRELSGLGASTSTYVNQAVGYGGSAANTLGQGAGIQQLVLSAPAIAGAAISPTAKARTSARIRIGKLLRRHREPLSPLAHLRSRGRLHPAVPAGALAFGARLGYLRPRRAEFLTA